MREYTTIDRVQNYILTEIDEDFTYQVTEWIEQISKFIENYTGRQFIADTTASIKKYDGNGINKMLIDEFTEITKLEINDTEIDSDDYYTYPANETPKNEIKLEGHRFSSGYQNIEVTAKWGYSTSCPEDLIFATTILVAGIIYNSWNQEGEVQSIAMGRYNVTYKDSKGWNDYRQAMDIIDKYKKFSF